MISRLNIPIIFILTTCFIISNAAAEPSDTNQSSKYLDAVREFADNVLKYGRDTYGPKHTPLFVDGLNIHTHEPVKWIDPDGTKWILSNLASQQNLFRTLDGLTEITGNPKYRQAAMDAIKYAFANLRSPNGLLYWGGHQAYDAEADKPHGSWIHELKAHYPYYQLMWEVDPQATKQFIESFWSAHILDWSNLDMDRHCNLMNENLDKPWEHEYQSGPAFFEGRGSSFFNTGSDLIYAAALLTKLSGDKEPLVWAKRLAHRYIKTRHPKTGISYGMYTLPRKEEVPASYDDVLKKLAPGTTDFPMTAFPLYCDVNPIAFKCCCGYYMPTPGITVHSELFMWQSQLLVGEMLGSEGEEFKHWALEEFTAFGKASYRKKDNVYVPILTDGTNLEGYVVKESGLLGPEGVTLKPLPAGPSDLWVYTMGYRLTKDEFMWEMAHNISKGNGFGDIGKTSGVEPELDLYTRCLDPYALLGFLELHRATGKNEFLEIAKRIGDNILVSRFHKGFFVAGDKHIYTKFDAIDSLVLLHLHLVLAREIPTIPEAWPNMPFFDNVYRKKDMVIDNQLIYTLTQYAEPTMSLQEAAAVGDVDLVRSLIEKGVDIEGREDSFFKTALHWAAISGHKDIVELLLDKGADVDARTVGRETPLHYATQRGHVEVVELLIAKGADINAKNNRGQTPLDIAIRQNREDIVKLLITKGARAPSIHMAVQAGALGGVKTFLEEGVDINLKDNRGYSPLHYAVREGHKDITEFLIAKGADIESKNEYGYTPLCTAVMGQNKDLVRLLVDKGADVNADIEGSLLPSFAVFGADKDIMEILIDYGAKFDVEDQDGWTTFRYAALEGRRDLIELFILRGADTSSFHHSACAGDLARVKNFIEEGIDVDTRDKLGWTPFYWAVANGQIDVAEFLIGKGANINAETDSVRTPLHQASQVGEVKMVEWLISQGAILEAKAKDGNTPLHSAAASGNEAVVELLISKGADVNAKNDFEQTPLQAAILRGHKDVAELLISKGADVNIRYSSGQSLLHILVEGGRSDMIEVVIDKGADINAKDNRGLTALHLAARSGQKDIVELLLNKGADVNAINFRGITSLDFARRRGFTKIAELLRKYRAKE